MARNTYVLRDGKHVNIKDLPADDPYWGPKTKGPYVMSDLPAYQSPIDGSVVDGRAARREDLKRNGCREVDPGERAKFLGE